jgi:hypothetical protein
VRPARRVENGEVSVDDGLSAVVTADSPVPGHIEHERANHGAGDGIGAPGDLAERAGIRRVHDRLVPERTVCRLF